MIQCTLSLLHLPIVSEQVMKIALELTNFLVLLLKLQIEISMHVFLKEYYTFRMICKYTQS